MMEVVLNRVCRACGRTVKELDTLELENPANRELQLLVKRYIPEFDVKVEKPYLCLDCHAHITRFHAFKRQCLRTEEELRLYVRKRPDVKKVNMNDVFNVIEVNIVMREEGFHAETEAPPNTKSLSHRCCLCRKSFVTSEGLQIHKQAIHEGKRFTCKDCGRVFVYEADYRKHERVHTDPKMKQYTCEVCGYVYPSKASLEKHSFTHKQVEERPFECSICKRRFCEKAVLKQHMRRHTGEKPYVCQYCGYATTALTGIYTHMNRRHNVDMKRKFYRGHRIFDVKGDECETSTSEDKK